MLILTGQKIHVIAYVDSVDQDRISRICSLILDPYCLLLCQIVLYKEKNAFELEILHTPLVQLQKPISGIKLCKG